MKKNIIKGLGMVLSIISLVIGIQWFFKGSEHASIFFIVSTLLFLISLLIGQWKSLSTFRKSLRVFGFIITIALSSLSLLMVSLSLNLSGYKVGKEPSDYSTRIELYDKDNVPGNSTRSKLDDMEYKENKNFLLSTLSFTNAIMGDTYKDRKKDIDTFTYGRQIQGGYEKETYEDIPYLIPYLVEDSDAAVIIIPGGGYGYKSLDGEDNEAKDVAKTLNDNGISAFLL